MAHPDYLREKARSLLREAAYEDGWSTCDELSADPSFRDFVCLYVAEG